MIKKLGEWLTSVLSKQRWWLLVIVGASLLLFQIFRYWDGRFASLSAWFMLETIVIVLGFIVFLMLLLSWHKTRLELSAIRSHMDMGVLVKGQMAAARDWDELTRIILQTARTILPVVGDALFFHNRSSGSCDLVARWSLDEHTGLLNISEKVSADCVMLLAEKMPQDEIYFGCKCSHDEVPDRRYQKLCLPLWKGDELVALLQLYMLSEVTLSREGLVLMKNLAGEMALILDHYQLQRRLVQQKEAVHEERYRIARHLHDTLAHNLAYLRLKLEQISNSEMGDTGPLRLEAKRLLDVSEQSYEIVRGLLFGLQENTPVDLTTAMKEYTASVSSRADFEINLNVVGEKQELPAEMNRQIFYIFREALRNVEKHARARHVEVQVAWENNVLCMEVVDDGQGVDEAAVRSGFGGYGLNFIRETIDDLGGVFDFTSSRLKGTRLGIRIPL